MESSQEKIMWSTVLNACRAKKLSTEYFNTVYHVRALSYVPDTFFNAAHQVK